MESQNDENNSGAKKPRSLPIILTPVLSIVTWFTGILTISNDDYIAAGIDLEGSSRDRGDDQSGT